MNIINVENITKVYTERELFSKASFYVQEREKIGIVGKYVELPDAYISIKESLFQAATYNDRRLKVSYFQSEKINDANVAEKLQDMDGIIVAPGAGQRGVEGKNIALKWCRENDIPTLVKGLSRWH